MEKEKKENSNVLLIVLAALTLVIAMVGATFAYFSATSTAESRNITTGELQIAATSSIEKNKDEYTIKIEDEKYVSTIFKKISKYKNVVKFVVEEPTLNEIFVSKVGEAYDEEV